MEHSAPADAVYTKAGRSESVEVQEELDSHIPLKK